VAVLPEFRHEFRTDQVGAADYDDLHVKPFRSPGIRSHPVAG
jgi:hypothetical protein